MSSTSEQPENLSQLVEFVRAASAVKASGGGSKPALSAQANLSLQRLAGMLHYDPGEYTFTARAGTTVEEVQGELLSHGQYLPFDPPRVHAGATLGGMIASGLNGPGRLRYGGVRDFLLAAQIVTGDGILLTTGAPVVKNAAGFDLPKLMVGSLGRLGIVATATFKVFPRPAKSLSLCAQCEGLAQAQAVVSRLNLAPLDLACLEWDDRHRLWVRVRGLPTSLPERARRVEALIREVTPCPVRHLTGDEDTALWDEAAEWNWVPEDCSLVKVALSPDRVPETVAAFKETRWRIGVAGNVLWLAWPDSLPRHELSTRLSQLHLPGLAITGAWHEPQLGAGENAFLERLQSALDPDRKFYPHHATSHSD